MRSLQSLLSTMRPTPSLIFQLPRNGAQLWASGKFQGFDAWVWDHSIALVVNLLGGVGKVGSFTFDMNGRGKDFDNWWQDLEEAVRLLTDTLYSGGHVLVHCQHGLHRTGSLIVLWLAVGLAAGDGLENMSNWHQLMEEAWTTWSLGRDLQLATVSDRKGRDYCQESWQAVQEFFSDLIWDEVQGLVNIFQRSASGIIDSMQSVPSSLSVTFRLPGQRPTPAAKRQPKGKDKGDTSKDKGAPPEDADKDKGDASKDKGAPPEDADKDKPKAVLKPAPKKRSRSPQSKQSQQSKPPQPPPPPPVPTSSRREKASSSRGPDWVPGAEWQEGDWNCRLCGNHNWRHRGFCNRVTCKAPRDASFRVGKDWYCKCGNFNKAHRSVCNRSTCQKPRAGNEQNP